ncbi:trna ligase [Coemansia interrupta]|uniref:Trna ligase n=1 Tax=Coemansia interrupta TaxID=1126814 RepID=A0A9W8HEG5_9FUNG|nr:trna ligase [Coemansia interrupta]
MSLQSTKASGKFMTPEEQDDFEQLLRKMTDISQSTSASQRIVLQKTYDVSGHTITSWRSIDFYYKKNPCPLPTQARGFFTSSLDSVEGKPRIYARGYDKFFNVNEVPKTEWDWIRANTQGPYEMTIKEDGCLILVSAIDETTLLVTSKHAIYVPHSDTASVWVDKHLALAGRTREELAAFLHNLNATAVFELCDDSFEEHVLEYPEETRGLYLHGINHNTLELNTWASEDVARVAEQFGFRKAGLYKFDTMDEGKALADRVRDDKMFNGRAIEGFVVRCRVDSKPYMFKIKYDEPYLMFYEWQKITSKILSDKPYRTRYAMSEPYARWVKKEIRLHPEAFISFGTKGVFRTRKRFLKYYEEANSGMPMEVEAVAPKIVLVPVATIGCGKTTMGHALSKLFGFAHVQSDNIRSKNQGKGLFNKAVIEALDVNDLVFADRNNHIRVMRQSLTNAVYAEHPGCYQVALYWAHNKASVEHILETTGERVNKRGEDHQSLVASLPNVCQIMEHFVGGFAPVDIDTDADQLFHNVIELDPLADAETTLVTIIDGLCNAYPQIIRRPGNDEIQAALQAALDYKPDVLYSSTIGSPFDNMCKDKKKKKNKNKKAEVEDAFITLPKD